MLTTSDLYTLCNRHDWFTSGDNDQYARMFDFARSSITLDFPTKIRELSIIIWICSVNYTIEQIVEIITNYLTERE